MTHPGLKRNMVPKAVLMRFGLVSLTTARPVNTTQPRTMVNSARPMTNVFNKAYSTVRRPINNKPITKNSNFNKRVNTVSGKNINTARPKAVVNAARLKAVLNDVMGNQGNPQQDLKEKGVIDSGCSSHMTGNMSYLTDFEEINGGYVSFRGNQSNGNAGTKACDDAGKPRMETIPSKDYILLPLWTVDPPFSQNSKSSPDAGFKPSSDDEKKADKDSSTESEIKEKEDTINRNFMPLKPNLSFSGLEEFVNEPIVSEPTIKKPVVETGKAKASTDKSKAIRKNNGAPLIEDWISDSLQEKGVIDSGCSRHMTGNMSYLTDFEEIDEGYVTFGGNPKGGKITGRGTNACDGCSSKSSQDDGSKPLSDDEKNVDEDPRKDSESIDQEKDDNVNSTNIPALEDYSIFDIASDDQDNGSEADMNNLDTTI
ncbi:hypothetical protein Tco_0495983 [Tanacetum coccineum]